VSTLAHHPSHASRAAAASDLFAFLCLVLVVVVASGLIAALGVEPALEATLLSALPGAVLLLAGCTVLILRRGRRWRDVGLSLSIRPGELAGQTLAVLAAVYLALLISAAIQGSTGDAQPDLGMFDALAGDWQAFMLALFVVWTAAAVGEEMLFRGFLLDRLAHLLGGSNIAWYAAAVLQGVLFGLSHIYQGAVGMWLTGVMGVIFGLAFLLTGRRLLPLILAHGLIDTISLTRMFLGE